VPPQIKSCLALRRPQKKSVGIAVGGYAGIGVGAIGVSETAAVLSPFVPGAGKVAVGAGKFAWLWLKPVALLGGIIFGVPKLLEGITNFIQKGEFKIEGGKSSSRGGGQSAGGGGHH
jgi:hypothetical protein